VQDLTGKATKGSLPVAEFEEVAMELYNVIINSGQSPISGNLQQIWNAIAGSAGHSARYIQASQFLGNGGSGCNVYYNIGVAAAVFGNTAAGYASATLGPFLTDGTLTGFRLLYYTSVTATPNDIGLAVNASALVATDALTDPPSGGINKGTDVSTWDFTSPATQYVLTDSGAQTFDAAATLVLAAGERLSLRIARPAGDAHTGAVSLLSVELIWA
jgi:hypothetical protein